MCDLEEEATKEELLRLIEDGENRTIYDKELTDVQKQYILRHAARDSTFIETYNEYLNEVAEYFANTMPGDKVELNDVSIEYSMILDNQSGMDEEDIPMNRPDLRHFPLDISELTDLINEKKRQQKQDK